MNILFLMKVFEVGGQEKVTAILAECFVNHGHKVTIASFATPKGLIIEQLDKNVSIVDLHSAFKSTKTVVDSIAHILEEKKIDIVINQWGLPFVPIKALNKAVERLYSNANAPKIISIYHNDPGSNARIKDVENSILECNCLIKSLILQFKKWCFKKVTSTSMRYVYNHSDLYQVLSPSYIEQFKKFTGVKNANHLVSLTNPVTIDSSDFSYDIVNKKKEIIFCGRLDYNQKRVCRVIDTWEILESQFPDWNLTIVGDGESRQDVEIQAQKLGLKRVSFEGFQQPLEYYKRASILILTSEYEGFPLVLAESMSFGVIPCVYGSFSAVYDIIKDGENGFVIEKTEEGFSPSKMAMQMSEIMTDEELRDCMAQEAIKTSKNYSIDSVYQQWEKVFVEMGFPNNSKK